MRRDKRRGMSMSMFPGHILYSEKPTYVIFSEDFIADRFSEGGGVR